MIPPLVLRLGVVEIKCVPTWLVARPYAVHDAHQFLGVNGQDQAATGTRRKRGSYQALLCGLDQNKERSVFQASLAPQAPAQF